MRITYSYGSRVGVEGLATTVYHDVRALHGGGLLAKLLCGYAGGADLAGVRIEALGRRDRVLRKLAAYDQSQWLLHAQNLFFDQWASRRLSDGSGNSAGAADTLMVWNTWGLSSLQRARQRGMLALLLRGSNDPRYAAALNADEYARWGARFRAPAARTARKAAEIDAADYVLIPNAGVAASFHRYGVAPEKLIPVGGRGADLARFRPLPRADDGVFRVLFVGSVNFGKGVQYLLEAWQQLAWRDAELWLVGGVGAQMQPVLERYRALPGLRILGHLRDPVPAFQRADAFVLPTLDDASVKVTYEAMACGVPVVTTPAATSDVRDGIEGHIVPIRDAAAIADRLERLRANPALRRAMGRAAYERAQEFSWDAYGQRLLRALASLPPPR